MLRTPLNTYLRKKLVTDMTIACRLMDVVRYGQVSPWSGLIYGNVWGKNIEVNSYKNTTSVKKGVLPSYKAELHHHF